MRKVLIADITIPSQGGKSQIARSSRAYTITSRTLLTAQSCRQYSQDETREATKAQKFGEAGGLLGDDHVRCAAHCEAREPGEKRYVVGERDKAEIVRHLYLHVAERRISR